MNLVKAMQDERWRLAQAAGVKHSQAAKREVADFNKMYHQLRWDVRFVGSQVSRRAGGWKRGLADGSGGWWRECAASS
jgi:hypothetical protein